MKNVANYLLEVAVAAMEAEKCAPVITMEANFSLLVIHSKSFSFLWAHDPVRDANLFRGRFLGEDIAQFDLTACVVGSPIKGAFRILIQAANKNTGKSQTFLIGDETDSGEKVYAWLIVGDANKGPAALKSFSIVEDGPQGCACFYGEHLSFKRKGRLEFMLALLQHFSATSFDVSRILEGGENNG